MNKGYALGFLLVLLVIVLGFYVAYTGFLSTRETLRAQPTAVEVVRATPRPTSTPVLSPTATLTTGLPTVVPGITATLTATLPPAAVLPATAEPSEAPAPLTPSPTPVPITKFEFRLGGPAGPDSAYANCCYIYGTVRDAAGQGLEGIQVMAVSQWNTVLTATSKGGVDLGKYDIPINRDAIAWTIMIVDAGGKQISTQVPVPFDPYRFNAYRVDWQRSQ
jgi:hypothetical protein